jgi:D-proline reductase (dithiol) PrdB
MSKRGKEEEKENMGSEHGHAGDVTPAATKPPTGDAAIRAAQNTLPVPDFGTTAFVKPPPLSEAVVAIVTTGGLHHADDQGWTPGTPTDPLDATWRADQSFRILDRSRRDYKLAHWSPNFDRAGFAADHNVVFPIDRLEEMAREGVIKDVAAKHLAFVGAQNGTMSTIRYDSGPAAAKFLKGIGVNLVFLTPICPVCTRTSGALAHVFEAEGIATVGISMVRGQTERLRPPRYLYCEFPFGRPLGKPSDPKFQRRVLDSAFSLLTRPQGPVLEDFPEVIGDQSNEPLACAMPPRFNPEAPAAVDEALALRPAYERQLAATKRTAMGRAMNADQVAAAVAAFVKIAEGAQWDSAGLPGNPTDTVCDLRAYYEEAAVALSDHVPAAKAAEAWIYQSTELGKVLKQARINMEAAGVPWDKWNQVVPINQLDQRGRQMEYERIRGYAQAAAAGAAGAAGLPGR